MRHFIYKILIFGIISLLLCSVIDYAYSRVLIRSNDARYESWYDLMHGRIDADIVISGNSRAWVQIDPMILDSILNVSSYNLGMNGSAVDRQVRKYKVFKKYNKTPKLIIQNIDFQSLSDCNRGYEREQFYPYFWSPSVREEFYETEPFSLAERYIPLFRYGGNFGFYFPSSQPRHLIKGYMGGDLKWDGRKLDEIDSISFSYDKSIAKLFNEFLFEMRNNGVKVVFVYTPIYVGATNKMTNLDEMYDFYRKIAEKYNIPILDYTYLDICNDTTYFYNSMHLNRIGAELFTKRLAKDLKSFL